MDRLRLIVYGIIKQRPDFVFIDGIADLMNNVNDIQESNMIKQFLLTISAIYDLHICTVLHKNEKGGEDAGRGHIGSEAARKCAAVVDVSAVEGREYSKVEVVSGRDATPEPFFIGWDVLLDCPRFIPDDEVEQINTKECKINDKTAADLDKIRAWCKGQCGGVQYADLKRWIMEHVKNKRGIPASNNTAERRITDAIRCKYIEKNERTGLYYPVDGEDEGDNTEDLNDL